MLNFYIYFAVIVSGASVLAVELLGTRIIAPFYGASLYLWSALISVALAALSVGYAIGGRWADRGPRLERFAILLGLAGLWIIVIPWLRMPALAISESAGLRAAVLITATVLFFPPLTLLGMISPYAIRLKAASLDVVGTTAGNLYSVSTIASVVAAVATGFFLIPNVGVTRLLLLIGFALLITSVLGLIVARRHKVALAAAIGLVVIGVGAIQFAPDLKADPSRGLIVVEQSAYGEIRVVDIDVARYLLIDGGTHNGIDTTTWDSFFGYVYVLDIPRGFFDRTGNMLLIGLGGGSVAKNYARAGWQVDAVEIDPVVTRLARSHFNLRDREANVYHMDGRQFLKSNTSTYDVVIMDAFGSSSIPFHLVTVEAFGLVKSALAEGGVLAVNLQGVGWQDPIVGAIAATVGEHFAHVTVLPMAEPPNQIGNLILLASERPLELKEELPLPMDRFSVEYDRAHAWDNRFLPKREGARVLTDDLNPIDVWAEYVNLVSRRNLHKTFTERGISW